MKNNHKNKKEFEDFILKTANYYAKKIGCTLYDFRVEFKNNTEYLAINVNYPYMNPIIYFSEKPFNDWLKNKFRKDFILHEILHIITEPIYIKSIERFVSKGEIEDERERLTDIICSILNKYIK